MEIFLTVLKYVAGPVIGALIGYLTNWLAVRMLFRPYYPKKIGKFRLPFTPGIIPKRKSALAKAVGKAVGEELFTKEDLGKIIVSDSAKEKVEEYAVNVWKSAGEKTCEEFLAGAVPADKKEELKGSAENFITDKIYSALCGVNLGKIVAEEGAKAVNAKKASLGMLAMFISDDLVSSLAGKLSEGVNAYVEKNGKEFVSQAVNKEFESMLKSPLSDITGRVDESIVRSAAGRIYEVAVNNLFAGVADSIDVCATVEEKINSMDVKDLEKLVLSVMKKELNAIVNLGALIGFILGVIMIFL